MDTRTSDALPPPKKIDISLNAYLLFCLAKTKQKTYQKKDLSLKEDPMESFEKKRTLLSNIIASLYQESQMLFFFSSVPLMFSPVQTITITIVFAP